MDYDDISNGYGELYREEQLKKLKIIKNNIKVNKTYHSFFPVLNFNLILKKSIFINTGVLVHKRIAYRFSVGYFLNI